MKLFHRDGATSTTTAELPDSDESDRTDGAGAYTPAKGRATPKRRDASPTSRGPVGPPPRNRREAMKRSKGNKEERRAAAGERRARMAAGDDRYLLPRDRGPVKAYVRDVIDARRNLMGLFMPLALLIFLALFAPLPRVQQAVTLVLTLMLLAMLIEGIFLGFMVNKKVRAKFPTATERSLGLGWYSFVRASQIRRMRIPKPRVKAGDRVS
ncbi:MAG: DUF3043 domain-containing protein [Sciscionella sp.]